MKDKLPDLNYDGAVLVIMSGRPTGNIELVSTYGLRVFCGDDGWFIEEYPEWENPGVTHWMPLPEPPKGGIEE